MSQVEQYNAGLDFRIPLELWRSTAASYINNNKRPFGNLSDRDFKLYFKLDPQGCTDLWEYIEKYSDPGNPYNEETPSMHLREFHLLWALHFLTTYAREEICAKFCLVSVKTWRKYVWAVLECMKVGGGRLVSSLLGHF